MFYPHFVCNCTSILLSFKGVIVLERFAQNSGNCHGQYIFVLVVAPRLAFLKLFQALRGKQLKINCNIVNVPADVTNTINILPRSSNETGTIKVQLKRKLQYKSCAMSLNVGPHKVLQAAAYLARNSMLYNIC